jgi:hypothetical protein
MSISRKSTVTDSQARSMYDDLKAKLGKARALRATGLRRRGMSEKDLYRCTLPGRVKVGIQLTHEKYVRGIDHMGAAKDEHMT